MLRLASRRSPLAMLQATYIAERLASLGVTSEIVPLETQADQRLDVPIASFGGQGAFAVEIQRAVLDGRADVAVHSAKDLPSMTPEGLVFACVPQRVDARDVLVGRSLEGLGPGATVATGSPRRRAFLLERRPDLTIVELRGNMATRLGHVGNGVDAIVAAAAALTRLTLTDVVAEYLDPTWFVPQVGQGALALECRSDDAVTRAHLIELHDVLAGRELLAERAFLRELGAGCSLPVAAHATAHADQVRVSAVMAHRDGVRSVRAVREGDDPEALGAALASYLRDERGGAALVG
jgi:hydroxymethylbilane synthase